MQRLRAPVLKDLARNFARPGLRSRNGRFTEVYWLLNGQNRGLSSAAGVQDVEEKIAAAVVLERLPVVLPPLSPEVAAFRQFSFEWQQQFRRHYPQEFLDASASRGEQDDNAAFEPAPTITEADKKNDTRSLQRSLDKRLYLILHGLPRGSTEGGPLWHFPQKVYSNEPNLRQCAEAAIGSLVGDLSKSVFFVGNAPCGHLVSSSLKASVMHTAWVSRGKKKKLKAIDSLHTLPMEPAEKQHGSLHHASNASDLVEQPDNVAFKMNDTWPSINRFFFRSQLLANDVLINKADYRDFAWISKEEVPLYFESTEADFLSALLQ